jgi:Glucose-1-phosphate thymidylyltransferase (EC 2.7.7.24)
LKKRQGYKIACLEEIAFNQDWLSLAQLQLQANQLRKNGYGEYLQNLLGDAQ